MEMIKEHNLNMNGQTIKEARKRRWYQMKEAKIEIRALTKSDARNQLINALDKIEGVKHASINQEGDTVKVTYRAPASEQQIEHCIYGAGNKLK